MTEGYADSVMRPGGHRGKVNERELANFHSDSGDLPVHSGQDDRLCRASWGFLEGASRLLQLGAERGW